MTPAEGTTELRARPAGALRLELAGVPAAYVELTRVDAPEAALRCVRVSAAQLLVVAPLEPGRWCARALLPVGDGELERGAWPLDVAASPVELRAGEQARLALRARGVRAPRRPRRLERPRASSS
ncbi:MAG: hypothetical protein H6828_15010 [Planctomycetes bacterium]|nr:hypothetical protein [Planctomycetota bacterium]